MSIVSEFREVAGLTQAELAARAGTSRTRLSAYENGHTEPGLEVVTRLARAAGLELGVTPAGTRAVGQRVARISESLAGNDQPYALRLVAELVDLVRSERLGFGTLADDPGSTGDRRWDALIAGCVELLAHEFGEVVPAWASAPARFLDEPWFFSPRRSLRAFIFVDTPATLASRNVFLSASSLASV